MQSFLQSTTTATVRCDVARGFIPLVFQWHKTQGKLASRSIRIIEDLRVLLTNYHPPSGQPFCFLVALADISSLIQPTTL